MAMASPSVLQRIFGGAQQFGQTLGAAPQSQQMQLAQMLAGAGAGMSQAANQPGASFGQAMGGGAQGMLQGQAQGQQHQMGQLQMEQAQAEMARVQADAERRKRMQHILGDMLGTGQGAGFTGQIAAQPTGGGQGYQQPQQQSGNIPPQAAQLLSLMDPDQAIQAMWEIENREPAELPSNVRELIWGFGGDEQAAQRALQGKLATEQQLAQARIASARASAAKAMRPDAPAAPDQRARKIAEYQGLYGVDVGEATAMADGLIQPIYNEQLGRTVMIDSRDPNNPKVREVEISPASEPSEAETPKETMFDIAARGNIAGALPAVSETLGRVTGQFGLLTDQQEQAVEDRQTVTLNNRALVRAMQDSPMYAQREREAIEKEIGINPSAFESQDGLLARMRSIRGVLDRRLAEARRIEGDPRMGEDIRRQAAKSANDIQSYLTQMGTEPPSVGFSLEPYDQEEQDLINRWAE